MSTKHLRPVVLSSCLPGLLFGIILLQLPAVTALYAGTEQLPAAVEAAVRAQQNNDTSVSLALAAARILEKVATYRVCCGGLRIEEGKSGEPKEACVC